MLNPSTVVRISDIAYSIQNNTDVNRLKAALRLKMMELVELPESAEKWDKQVFSGSSGGLFFKGRSGFGFAAYRADSGEVNKSELVVSLRGTGSLKDVITDANFFTTSTDDGSVHLGFYSCFKSILTDIEEYFRKTPPPEVVHCIGHSLGGALATLVARHISKLYYRKVYLYTLGSPRVGLNQFASCVSSSIHPSRIFRLHHTADPVSVVPIWPFCHIPHSDDGYAMGRFGAGFQFSAHRGREYLVSVGRKSWDILADESRRVLSRDQVEHWLQSKEPASFTARCLMMLSEAIYYVLKKLGLSTLINTAAGAVATSGYTLLDILSAAIKSGMKLPENLSRWAVLLIKKMMEILGIAQKIEPEKISKEFINNLFVSLHKKVNVEVVKAIDGLEE